MDNDNKEDFELLLKQIENNITDWYPFDEKVNYTILKNLSKENKIELEEIAKKLQDNDRLLILLNNNLGIKNICLNNDEENKLFNRKEIENLLDKNGLIYRKFYYPLPDCRMTNVIFTDKHLPDKETISRNINFYEEKEIEKNNENKEFKKLLSLDSNLFKIFANSFLIECSKTEFEDNGIEFVSFSNMRKEEYRIKTIIKGDNVYKQAGNETSKEHIKQIMKNIDILNQVQLNTLDRYENETIISSYQKDKETLDKIIIDILSNNEKELAKKIIRDLFEELKQKLIIVENEKNVFDKYEINYKKEDIENLTFVKYGLWDAIFQNIFYIDNKYFFYDQEWLEKNLPLEFIIYRAIIYCPELQKELDKQELFNEFNIKAENIKLFQDLDNKLQEKTRNEISWKLHRNLININEGKQVLIKLAQDKEKITEDCIKLLNEKDSRIKFLEDNMEQTCSLLKQKEEQIELMKNSTSWKITEPLRKLRGYKKGEKNENKR